MGKSYQRYDFYQGYEALQQRSTPIPDPATRCFWSEEGSDVEYDSGQRTSRRRSTAAIVNAMEAILKALRILTVNEIAGLNRERAVCGIREWRKAQFNAFSPTAAFGHSRDNVPVRRHCTTLPSGTEGASDVRM